LIAMGLFLGPAVSAAAEEITVAAAANLQFTAAELKTEFERTTGHSVKLILGSSGKLTAQIENGAPVNVFISADEDFPRRLYNDGITVGEPKVYAKGVLVLWTLREIDLSPGLAVLADTKVKKIAIASPRLAPYGRQAVSAMKHARLYPSIEAKLVYGESIAQANQFIMTQAADIGFTSKSIVLAANMHGKGRWVEVDPNAYSPIAQAAVIIKGPRQKQQAAVQFFDFLFSPAAAEIFKKYGYLLP